MALPRTHTRGKEGFTLVELLVVMMVAGIVAAAILALYAAAFRTTADQTVRMQNQDSVRLAIYEMSRYIRAACSSDANLTSLSDSLLLAEPQELVLFVDLDQDGSAEKVRYYVTDGTLRMQTTPADRSDIPPTYPDEHETESLVILDGVQNGEDSIFTYFGCDEQTTSLYEIPAPHTDAARRAVVVVGIRLVVNERPEIARGAAEMSTRVQIRQRYNGGLDAG